MTHNCPTWATEPVLGSLGALAAYRDEAGRLAHGRKAGRAYFTDKGLPREIAEELADAWNYSLQMPGWRMAAMRVLLRVCWWLNGGGR